MEKHYKIREDLSINFRGTKLFRIEATKDLPRHNVKKGDIGGYIEKYENLSDNAWVFGDAKVLGKAEVNERARVCGNAIVSGDALVYGNAQVSKGAQIAGKARVCGEAQIFGYAQVFGNAQVLSNAWVFDDAKVHGNAIVSGDAIVSGNATAHGNAYVSGSARVCGGVIKSKKDCVNIISEKYNITIMPEHLQIGCQCHSKEDWWGFSDRKILAMDGRSGLRWWKKWKPILMAICE